jgi:hypothetical protein
MEKCPHDDWATKCQKTTKIDGKRVEINGNFCQTLHKQQNAAKS